MSDVWNSDSCCSFATLSDSPKLLLSFLLGIVISWTVVMWFKLDRSSKPEPRSNRVTDGDSGHCELPHCLRCCSITRRNVESNILEKWKLYLQHTGEEQHLKPVNEAVLSFVATRPASEKDKQLESSQNPTVFSVPRLHSQPWWDYFGSTSYEHDLKLLKSRAETIKKEFLQMDRKYSMKDDLFSDWIVNVESQWRMCHLINQGTYVKDICDQCPGTYQVLRQLKNCMDGCIFGYASFSVVEARASLLSHTGPTNVRLRCHLGLVDAVECELVVSGQTRRWKEGHCLVFDDSFYHSVSNCGDNARAILIVDMWHPDLTLEQRRAITYLFPAVSDYPLSQELH